MPYLFFSSCLALSLVFGVSAASKSGRTRFRDFQATAGPLEVIPKVARGFSARAVVAAELVLTATLLTGAAAVFSSGLVRVAVGALAGAIVLLLAFTVGIVLTLRRGGRRPCRCFGAKATPLGIGHVIRNVFLLALAASALAGLAAGDLAVAPAGTALAGVAGLVIGLLVTRFDDLADLFSPAEISAGSR